MSAPKNRMVNNNHGRDQFVGNSGPITVNNNAPSESVLEKLVPRISTNALHNAKGRASRRACLEGTRGGFIEKLGKWIEDPEGNGPVHWVRAGAGVGKTAIAQTLCEKYSLIENIEGQVLAAAFFFSRNDPSRNNMDQFVPTIAYQLARSPALQPHLADAIDTAIRSDPGIMGADWENQFQRLICEPCKRISPELWKTLPRLVIIDGLDECMDVHEPQTTDQRRNAWERDGQSRLLSMIQNSLTAPSSLPLRFLIFSRPEHTISNFFRNQSIPDLVQLDMRELRSEADSDIFLYLTQEFARLVKVRQDADLDPSWPGEEAIQALTIKSDGHFVYVVTVVKYLMDEDPSSTPQARLSIILLPRPSTHPDLSPLDELYLQILQPFLNMRELLLPLLQLIMAPPQRSLSHAAIVIPDDSYRSRCFLAELLNQPDSRHIAIILSRLRSVLYVPDNEDEAVSVLHASFSDFLSNQRRSNDFYVKSLDRPQYLDKLFPSSLRVLKRVMLRYKTDKGCAWPREPPVIEAWAFNTWFTLVERINIGFGASSEGAPESLEEAVEDFDAYCYVNMLNDRYVF
ncbi:hypothetical protein V5O48_008069 [Marasmius crinis-equi]|uniref:Nephrocystin 3-like N-terminal domain-containing protein n=1 Tax=Marasmius crinis-equi TaxID=585013 RepID=A0ABR3FEX8_9AGAR